VALTSAGWLVVLGVTVAWFLGVQKQQNQEMQMLIEKAKILIDKSERRAK